MDGSPKLIKGLQAEFVPAEWSGTNTSGLIVYGKNVLVRMDECGDVSSGGVALPMDLIDRMTEAAETGCIYSLGPEAFHLFEDGVRWTGDKPKPGDRVYLEKFSGLLARGKDGGVYRIMDYRCVAAGLEPDLEG